MLGVWKEDPRGMCIASNYSAIYKSLLLALELSQSYNIFPPVVCNTCYSTAKEDDADIVTTISVHMWKPHIDGCQLYLEEVGRYSSGDWPKQNMKGRPMDD